MDTSRPAPIIRAIVAPFYGTNCYLVVVGPECVVVDAGAGVAPEVELLIAAMRLTPRAVLATHGHADHTWDAGPLCARAGVPFVVHADDAYRLDDPLGTIAFGPGGDGMDAQLRAVGIDPGAYVPPAVVQPIAAGAATTTLRFGAVELTAIHAPGHTEGSTLYAVGTPESGALLTGDVLFAGTIGRYDLPGGDGDAMNRTLGDVIGGLPDEWRVLPGHGPETTMARERRVNPFLRSLI